MALLKTVFQHNVKDLAKLICLTSPMRSYTILSYCYRYNDDVNNYQQSILFKQKHQPNLEISKRFKKKQTKVEKILEEIKELQEEESDSDEDEDDDDDGDKKLLTQRVSSMRLDVLAKISAGMTRNKVEKLFYDGKVYLNGVKATKKGADIKLNDIIEVVKEEGIEKSLVSKLTLVDWKHENNGYKITFTRENVESADYKSQ